MSETVGIGLSAAGHLAPEARLSCELCTQRKKRCDKLNPCSYCQRQGAVCKPVVRQRLPRGKHRVGKGGPPTNNDGDLRSRVARLEHLLQQREQERGGGSSHRDIPESIESSFVPSATSWDTSNVPCARKNDDDGDVQFLGGSPWSDVKGQSECVFATSSGAHDPELHRSLVEIFLSRIDPVFKVIHQPSLRAYLLEGKQYLDYDDGHHAPNTLASAIYYAAVCILSEEECDRVFKEHKSSVVAKYRRVCDAALYHADFPTTNDLTVLQAFMISLLSYRLLDQGRRVWTMLSMALRVGQALSLHIVNPPFSIRPLEMELRRRVWHAIGILDAQSSLDRATEPMVIPAWLEQNTPSNINDNDIGFFSNAIPQETTKYTDMTFTLLVAKAHKVMRSLNFSRWTQHGIMDMEDRQSIVIEFQKEAIKLVSGCSPDNDPLQWLTVKSAECLTASLQLAALRPLQRDSSFTPPQVKNNGLLKLSVDILQRSQDLSENPVVGSWGWFQQLWAPWHPLSVALAELCACDDFSVMEAYWSTVEHSFRVVGHAVADSKDGMLWKPIDKLMRQAESKRAALITTTIPREPQQPVPDNQLARNKTQGSTLSSTSNEQSAVGEALPAMKTSEQNTSEPDTPKDIWEILNFDDWTEDLGQTSWSSFTSFLDDLHEADDSILTFA